MESKADSSSIRDELFDAARDLIGKIGYVEMSHADLTAIVGIGRTTFYEHFTSKEDLLVQMVRRDLPPLVAEIVDSIDDSLPPDDRLLALARSMVEFVGTDHVGLILHTEVPHLSPGAQEQISEAHTGLSMAFASTYREGVQAGMFRKIPPRLAGRMMEQMIMAGGQAVMDASDPGSEVSEIARYTADMVVSAFRVEKS
ncbi:MAG: TetR/AcrR family transcriptional regulator [Actinomycetota bacterium]|nr:TetR/AcrR family transcriptional regulator [Actinomycetota bacterium]MDK1026995.1 TetR/AcrR family transcriptional regulator [Actinomycetota bacterium]MDK1039333.1 TetR/AcrR family transcriptional regulator [Actinomycetota bacterium]MDK1097463.1 TetR/AcrR family transcriptional regulator [Actinomycetota bacterium]MDK1103478.1 TetR/AcrR family transcriptional regulator [Actinomycetota bacterium]